MMTSTNLIAETFRSRKILFGKTNRWFHFSCIRIVNVKWHIQNEERVAINFDLINWIEENVTNNKIEKFFLPLHFFFSNNGNAHPARCTSISSKFFSMSMFWNFETFAWRFKIKFGILAWKIELKSFGKWNELTNNERRRKNKETNNIQLFAIHL